MTMSLVFSVLKVSKHSSTGRDVRINHNGAHLNQKPAEKAEVVFTVTRSVALKCGFQFFEYSLITDAGPENPANRETALGRLRGIVLLINVRTLKC